MFFMQILAKKWQKVLPDLSVAVTHPSTIPLTASTSTNAS
jgi:hypothetical protein